MLQCPHCSYAHKLYNTVYRHLKRKHPDEGFIKGCIKKTHSQSHIEPALPIAQESTSLLQQVQAQDLQMSDRTQTLVTDDASLYIDEDEFIELKNAIRTYKFSNDGLSMLLELKEQELDAYDKRIIYLEQALSDAGRNEENACIIANGNAIDLNSRLLIAEFNLTCLQVLSKSKRRKQNTTSEKK